MLKVSPSFLEQYIAAARVVSETAVGLPNAKRDSRVYYAEPGINQNYHVAGMPLGTRGGMLVAHYFPADGEYEIDLGGLARARYVEGLDYRHRLIVAIDGKKVFENEIGGADDVEAVDLRQAAAVAEINGRFENIRVSMTAGPHTIAATFVARTMSESDAVLQPFVPGGGEVGIIEGEESPLKIERLEINGPFDASGMSVTPSRDRIFSCRPQTPADEAPCAREIVTRLTRQAFRRPLTDADLAIPLTVYEQGRANGDFEAGVRNALMIVLASPEFLYRFTAPPDDAAPGSVYAVDQYGLASRLSFFLWSSVPDDELLTLAERGELGDARVLSSQVERMLADPRAAALVTNFGQQWLDIRGVRDIVPDPVLFPEYNPNLGDASAREIELFVASVLLEDRSVLEPLECEPHVLERTAGGCTTALPVCAATISGASSRPTRTAGACSGKGGILMATSYPNRTAPVLRGAWILEAITGTPPASPPPDVEAFPETQEGEQPKTVRERLDAFQSELQRLSRRHGPARLRAKISMRSAHGASRIARPVCRSTPRVSFRRRHRRQRSQGELRDALPRGADRSSANLDREAHDLRAGPQPGAFRHAGRAARRARREPRGLSLLGDFGRHREERAVQIRHGAARRR